MCVARALQACPKTYSEPPDASSPYISSMSEVVVHTNPPLHSSQAISQRRRAAGVTIREIECCEECVVELTGVDDCTVCVFGSVWRAQSTQECFALPAAGLCFVLVS